MPSSDPCGDLSSATFAWGISITTSSLFGLLFLISALCCVLLVLRWNRIKLVLIKFFIFAFLSTTSASICVKAIAAILSKHSLHWSRMERVFYPVFHSALAGATTFLCVLVLIQSPKTKWKIAAYISLGITWCFVFAVVSAAIGLSSVIVNSCVAGGAFAESMTFAFTLQASSNTRAKVAMKDLIVQRAVIFLFLVRSCIQCILSIILAVEKQSHWNAINEMLGYISFEIFPLILLHASLWPSLPPSQSKVKTGAFLLNIINELAFKASILTFFYGMVLFLFAAGVSSACSTSWGKLYGWPVILGSASSQVLVNATPLLLLSVMFGTLSFLRRTFLHLIIPFDSSLAFHMHVAIVWMAMLLIHSITHIDTMVIQMLPWVTGGVLMGFALIAFVAGTIYVNRNTMCSCCSKFQFPVFLWLHRLGYTCILLLPLHGWSTLKQDPLQWIIWMLVVSAWLCELFVRALRLAKGASYSIERVSERFFFLHIQISNKAASNFVAGQWCYLTLSKRMYERHPFTIADTSSVLSSSGSINNNNDNHDDNGTATLSFMIKVTDGRPSSWTRMVYEQSNIGSLFVDGPFSSPASNLFLPTVTHAVLIGVGSGITGPLGILSNDRLRRQCQWSSLVFVCRDGALLDEIAAILHALRQRDEARGVSFLPGGAYLYMTGRGSVLKSNFNDMLNHRRGRPDWYALLDELNMQCDTFNVDCLYTGPQAPLVEIRKWTSGTNVAFFAGGGTQTAQWSLHEEVF